MAKPEIIKSNRKRTFRFSNFKKLEKGLEIAIGRKWSKFIINGVAEDKIEIVEDWINISLRTNLRKQHLRGSWLFRIRPHLFGQWNLLGQ